MTPKIKVPPHLGITFPRDMATNPPVEAASRSASSTIPLKDKPPRSPGRPSTGNSSTSLAPITTPIKNSVSSSSSPSTPSTRLFSSPSATSITSTSPSSSVSTSPTHKSPPSRTHNPHALPNYTSALLPKSLLISFSLSEPLTPQGTAYPQHTFFDFFDPFYGAMKEIDSLYGSQFPAAQIISAILEWKNTPTITGLIIRASETARGLSFTERLQILYVLAFASHDFTLKFVCLMSELDDTTEIGAWLENFIFAVESKLAKGVTEISYFDEEEQKKLIEAYSQKVKNTDLKIVGNPGDLASRFSNHRSDNATHSMVKSDTIAIWISKSGVARSYSRTGSDDDEFWS